jgi:enamine deaminase RidA (YjgF/YER057c/UK114 family)
MPDPAAGNTPAASAPRFEPDERWVPADERRFGLDRRTLRPTLAVLALVILMSVVLPVINASVPYHDIARAGDVVQLGGQVTFVPQAGWGITSGLRAGHAPLSGEYPSTAVVEHGALKFTVRTGPFHGDTVQLLDQIEATSEALNRGRGVRINSTPTTVITTQGKEGASVHVTGPHTSGVIAAFVFGDRGVEAVATGPSDAGTEPSVAVLRMIDSISQTEKRKQ